MNLCLSVYICVLVCERLFVEVYAFRLLVLRKQNSMLVKDGSSGNLELLVYRFLSLEVKA